MKINFYWSWLFLLVPASALCATTENITAKSEIKSKLRWDLSASVSQLSSYRMGEPSTTVSGLSGRHKIDEKQTLGFSQSLTKKYEIIAGEDEWDFSDTTISHDYSWSQKVHGFAVGSSLATTIPLSSFSIKHGVVTKPSASVSLSRSFVDDRLSISLSPAAQYNINQYTTTVTGDGAMGGRPLRQWSAGLNTAVNYKINDNFNLSSSQGWSRVYYEETYINQTMLTGLYNPPDHEYYWNLSMNYSATHNLSVTVGHSMGNRAENLGGIEVVAFDDQIAQWYVSIGYNF